VRSLYTTQSRIPVRVTEARPTGYGPVVLVSGACDTPIDIIGESHEGRTHGDWRPIHTVFPVGERRWTTFEAWHDGSRTQDVDNCVDREDPFVTQEAGVQR